MDQGTTVGAEFARALVAKDSARLLDLVHPEIDFRGLAPNRTWEAGDPEGFEELESDSFSDRRRVGYRFSVRNPDGRFLVEQQAYLQASDGQIDWMRVLCSGFRPAPAPD